MQYGGYLPRQTTHAVHEHLLPKPGQTTEEARAWFGLYIRKERKPFPDRGAVAWTQAETAHMVMPKAVK